MTQLVLDLGGVFFFAMSGALLAARKGFDIVGSYLLAAMTGLGGGVLRVLSIWRGWRVPLAHSSRHRTRPRDTL